MNFKELLKKYWFVGLIALVLLVFIGVYAIDAYNNRELTVSDKQIDGKYAVYSVDDSYVFADDIYQDLYDNSGISCILTQLQRLAVSSYETTDDMNSIATSYASSYLQYYGEEYWNDYLKQRGYLNGADDLVEFFINDQKFALLLRDYATDGKEEIVNYIDANEDEFNSFVSQYNPRVVRHILVKIADVEQSADESGNTVYTANATDEEQAKLDEVLKLLETKSFEEVANEYSDDATETGGYIGCVDTYSNIYVEPFTNASLALEDGQVSEPVLSEFGYHIIKNEGSSKEILIDDAQFIQEFINSSQALQIKAIIEKANQLGYEVNDEEFNKTINEYIGSEVIE